MSRRDVFTKILAIFGSILVWIPIAAPLIFVIPHSVRGGKFQVDYLLPAELFPVVAIGIGLLLWAAIRARSYIKWLVWSIGTILISLAGGALVARISGLANGDIEPTGFWWRVVLGAFFLYILAIISIGTVGCYLIKKLFTRNENG